MKYIITIPYTLPDLNKYIKTNRGNKYAANKEKQSAEDELILLIRSQLRGVTLQPPVSLHYTWYEPNMRKDADNVAFAKKFVQDALVKAKALPNDGRKVITGFTDIVTVDRKRPRVEVVIVEREKEQK